MATVYVKRVDSSSRSAWTSGNSYVVGDRVYLESATLKSYSLTGVEFASWRTYVCLVDNASTTSPEEDSVNWAEAGASKEYPYHCIGGNLGLASEVYLEATNKRWATSSLNGSLYHHLRRGESLFSLGKMIIVADEPNPVFFMNLDCAVIGFSVEPDPSIGRFSIVQIGIATLGSDATYNDTDTPYGKVDKCDIYSSGNASAITGGIYDNSNAIEFTDCLFSEQASKVGYADCAPTGGSVRLGQRTFYGFRRCSFFFPSLNHALGTNLVYDTMPHSTGQRSFITSCTFWFKSWGSTNLFNSTKAGDVFKDNIFYFSEQNDTSSSMSILSANSSAATYENNVFYINNSSMSITPTTGFKNINPELVGTTTSPDGLQLRPSSPLIGGFSSQNTSAYDKVLYITPAASTEIRGEWEAKTNTNLNPDWTAGNRCNYNGEVYEALVNHDTDDTSTPPDQDTTNWRLVPAGDINDPYRATDLGPSVLNSLTDSSVIFMLDGEYTVIPICYNIVTWNGDSLLSNHPQNGKPLLTPLNKGKVTISQSNFTPANILCKDIKISSPMVYGYGNYPENIGFHFSGCTLNTGQWWPPSNSIAENCLIFSSGVHFFYGSVGQTNNPASTSKGIQFIGNTVIRSPSNGYFFTGLINQGLSRALFKNNIFYAKSGSTFTSSNTNVHMLLSKSTFIDNVAFDETGFVDAGYTDDLVNIDPKFINSNGSSIEDFRLRPDSPLIGGIKKDPTNVYYLQPGNTYNGDGSQKDASSMTADGDAGPFNNFQEILAAGVPYGSTVVIVNGTYAWPNNFHTRKTPANWDGLTYEGYNYKAETFGEVIFDANKQAKFLGYQPFGGTTGSGAYLDLDTTFTGIQFNNVAGGVELNSRNQIYTNSSSAGFGSCTFNNCQFLNWINTGGSTSYPWTGGGRDQYGSAMHWKGCTIVIAFDGAGSLLGGGDGFASDSLHGPWSWENCTFYIPVGLTTFNGRNASNGTYQSPTILFGYSYNQSQRIFKNNIVYIPGGNTSIGTTLVSNLPDMKNNCFLGVVPRAEYFDFVNDNNLLDVEPKFVDPANANFTLRPNSPITGKG